MLFRSLVGSLLSDGAHTINLRAMDVAGNPSAAATLNVSIDATAPSVVGALVKDSDGNDNTPTFSWTRAIDALSGISHNQVKINDEAWVDIGDVETYTWATELDDGEYTLYVRAVDSATNVGAQAELVFVIDMVIPSAPANVAVTTNANDTTPTFTWDAATDAGSGIAFYQVKMDDGAYVDVGDVITYTVTTELAAGAHVLTVRAVDGSGNASDVGTVNFTIAAASSNTMILIVVILVMVIAAAAVVMITIRKQKKSRMR